MIHGHSHSEPDLQAPPPSQYSHFHSNSHRRRVQYLPIAGSASACCFASCIHLASCMLPEQPARPDPTSQASVNVGLLAVGCCNLATTAGCWLISMPMPWPCVHPCDRYLTSPCLAFLAQRPPSWRCSELCLSLCLSAGPHPSHPVKPVPTQQYVILARCNVSTWLLSARARIRDPATSAIIVPDEPCDSLTRSPAVRLAYHNRDVGTASQ